jgi:hypothetical protein
MTVVVPGIEIPGIYLPGTTVPDPLPLSIDEWYGWYNRQLARRLDVMREVNAPGVAGHKARIGHKGLCLTPGGLGHLYWLNTFCFISEPRGANSAVIPWVTWPRQAEMILQIHEAMAHPSPHPMANMATEKTRACGATWTDMSHHAWEWSFSPYYTGLLIGKTEDDVDRAGDQNAMMWKLDFILGRHLTRAGNRYPTWLLPHGLDWDNERKRGGNRTELQLNNPETGSTIRGEATTPDAGRGARVRKLTIDEAGFNEYFDLIWSSVQNVTDHAFAYSTANLKYPGFYNLVKGLEGYTKPRTFRFEWHQIPGHDLDWYENQKASMKEDRFKVEILIDYHASQRHKYVYPDAQAVPIGDFGYEPGLGKVSVVIDDGLYPDPTAILVLQHESGTEWHRIVAAYQNVGKTIDFYGGILTNDIPAKYTRHLTRHDLDFARWCGEIGLARVARFYGDRHGDQKNQVTGTSPFHVLQQDYGIYVNVNTTPEFNAIENRRESLASLVPWLKCNSKLGAPFALQMLQEHHLPDTTPNRVTPITAGVHDDTSHLTSAFEYYAMNLPRHATGLGRRAQESRKSATVSPLDMQRGRKPVSSGRFSNRTILGAAR